MSKSNPAGWLMRLLINQQKYDVSLYRTPEGLQ